jgi:hypothetical protein
MTPSERPLPPAIGWLAIILNVGVLCAEAGLFISRGLIALPEEVVMVSLLIGTPIFNLALFLDYRRRGL